MVGRKTKHTPETIKKIVDAITMGATYQLACQYGGIHIDTFYDWMNNKPDFSEAVKEAEGAGAVQLLARIRKEANEGTWQAAAWILERRHPDMYGRQRIEHTGANGKPIEVKSIKELTDDELDALIEGRKSN